MSHFTFPMYRIKICGITSADDALLAAEAGADAIGVNFYEKSPRYVRPDEAAEIVDRLREEYPAEKVQVFGVFVNSTLDDIIWTIREANLYGPDRGFGIQLHGDEPPELIRDLHRQGLGQSGTLLQVTGHVPTVPIVRAFRCRGADLAAEEQYLKQCTELEAVPQAVLLDAFAPDAFGGTGQCVDWATVRRDRHRLAELPLVLAGGLKPDNVAAAIAAAKPDAVDVASGVESTPRTKDAAKVYAFAAAARAAFAKR
jgi:phosphoribosylanthranilate isomerase